MKETNIYEYFAFGFNYNILSEGARGLAIAGEVSLATLLDEFLVKLEQLDLPVTRNAAFGLKEIRAELGKRKPGEQVDEDLAKRLAGHFKRLDTVLDSELQLRNAYVVAPKRFDVNLLLRTPLELLGEAARNDLPPICRFDFGQACRCVAFSLPTAAAFHLMRCVEGMLRHYYCKVVKRNRVQPLLWGKMIEQLKIRRNGPPKALLDHLDNIRTNFRNPTQHPDAQYDLEGAQDLLAVATDALNRLARDLRSREGKGSSGS